jgi:hypothetical protein
MNPEDFTFYGALALIVAVAGVIILFDAWLDRRDADAEDCCPPATAATNAITGWGNERCIASAS